MIIEGDVDHATARCLLHLNPTSLGTVAEGEGMLALDVTLEGAVGGPAPRGLGQNQR